MTSTQSCFLPNPASPFIWIMVAAPGGTRQTT
jgi:hypothetical protein